MYVVYFPCNDCAKIIIQSGIRQVVYIREHKNDDTDESYHAARLLFEMAGVTIRKYTSERTQILLQFYKTETLAKDLTSSSSSNGKGVSTVEPNACSVHSSLEHLDQSKFHALLLEKEAGYKIPPQSTKRQSYLSWDDYFICVAFLSAQRSKDPNTQVGACIVNTAKRIVGIGYNGFPQGCSDDILPWRRDGDFLEKKYAYVCHAEANAILNKGGADLHGSTLYVDLFPCNECAKLIIQAGIREVVYLHDTYHDTDGCRASRILFQMSGVKCRQHKPPMKELLLEFAERR